MISSSAISLKKNYSSAVGWVKRNGHNTYSLIMIEEDKRKKAWWGRGYDWTAKDKGIEITRGEGNKSFQISCFSSRKIISPIKTFGDGQKRFLEARAFSSNPAGENLGIKLGVINRLREKIPSLKKKP